MNDVKCEFVGDRRDVRYLRTVRFQNQEYAVARVSRHWVLPLRMPPSSSIAFGSVLATCTCRIFFCTFRVTFHRAHTVHDTIGFLPHIAGLEAMFFLTTALRVCKLNTSVLQTSGILDNILKPLGKIVERNLIDLALVKLRQIHVDETKRSSAMDFRTRISVVRSTEHVKS